MILFTPNTVIKSADINLNFDGLADGTLIDANAISISRLAAIENTDFCNGVALTQNVWGDIKANQNFVVSSTNSIITINVSGVVYVGGSGNPSIASRLVIDSAGTPIYRYLGGTYVPGTNNFQNALSGAGTHTLTNLSAGTHTLKTQVFTTTAGCAAYSRPLSIPNNEFFATYVMEYKK